MKFQSFYENFLTDKTQLSVIHNAYKGVVDILEKELKYIDDLGTVAHVPTYKTIPFQIIDATEVSYSLKDILNLDLSPLGLPIDQNATNDEKMKQWNDLNHFQKSDIIDFAGYSIMLTSFRNIRSENNISLDSNFIVESFDIYDYNGTPLVRNVDYTLRENKLVLLNEFDIKDATKKKMLTLRNIVVDSNAPQEKIGDQLKIEYDKDFTRIDYNETLKAFAKAGLKGPTLENLNGSFDGYSTLNGIRIYDKCSADKSKRKFWDDPKTAITPFDFIVSTPAEFLNRDEKLKYINDFFAKIKPAYTNFIFMPELKIKDSIYMNRIESINTVLMKNYIRLDDHINGKENQRSFYRMQILDQAQSNLWSENPRLDDCYICDADVFLDRVDFIDKGIGRLVSAYLSDKLILSDLDNKPEIRLVKTVKNNISHKEGSKTVIKYKALDSIEPGNIPRVDEYNYADTGIPVDVNLFAENKRVKIKLNIINKVTARDNIVVNKKSI